MDCQLPDAIGPPFSADSPHVIKLSESSLHISSGLLLVEERWAGYEEAAEFEESGTTRSAQSVSTGLSISCTLKSRQYLQLLLFFFFSPRQQERIVL